MRPLPHFLLQRVIIFRGAAAARASAPPGVVAISRRSAGPPLRRPVVSGRRPPRWPSFWLASGLKQTSPPPLVAPLHASCSAEEGGPATAGSRRKIWQWDARRS
ncbi:hypothetical protein VPH35_061182 [Triticum aestivum]